MTSQRLLEANRQRSQAAIRLLIAVRRAERPEKAPEGASSSHDVWRVRIASRASAPVSADTGGEVVAETKFTEDSDLETDQPT